ncbi:hypothetical protein [Bradyrhizobium sp. 169]|uniref:hypothetical protein n=1 Tax=Bradyrhizobium sp. 169 TaxID=2782640 RepID=UPI001FF7DD92|nr:hypothetical protein [Bradyrhizobium sp. 169]MCK1592902.1 hypothetical protein [Bradyrhizobium sp. 169]
MPLILQRGASVQAPYTPAGADLIADLKASGGLTFSGACHHFVDTTSVIMALSGIASASNFFSFVFSFSKAFRRSASNAFSPPYPFVEGCAADPHLRHTSAAFAGFLLPQHSDDLFLREPARLHAIPLRSDRLYQYWEEICGAQVS